MNFHSYNTDGFYDELIEAPGRPRGGAIPLIERLESLPEGDLVGRQKAAEAALLQLGVTFNVYGHQAGTEKIWPFDIVPRIVEAKDWAYIERGLIQRIEALNLFIADIYGPQKIIHDGIVPRALIESASAYRPQCVGFTPPVGVWCHITGTDLVRDSDGQFYVLEDNMRCPSGVSYVLENRNLLKRTFPKAFEACRVRPVDEYGSRLLDTLRCLAPRRRR